MLTKRITALFLVLMMLLSAVACNNTSNDTDNAEAEKTKDAAKTTANTEDDTTDTELPTESTADTEQTEADTEKTDVPAEDSEAIVVVDNDECKIVITGFENDDLWGYSAKVELENKSADKTYMYTVDDTAVNGVQVVSLFATTVGPGKKAVDSIPLEDDIFEEIGLTEYTDIKLTLRVYDSEDYMADDVAYETVHLYPSGKDNAENFVRESKPTDTVLVDNEYVTIIVTGYEMDDMWGYSVNLFIDNKTDKELMVNFEDVSVNGYMADPFFATIVHGGNRAFDNVSWFEQDLAELGITDVTEIEFKLTIYDMNDFMSNPYVDDIFKLNP